MSAGSETILAGQYTVTYGGVAMGIMEGDGGVPTIEHSPHGEPVNNTDRWGKSMITAIYQGGDWFATYVCMEYKAGPISAFWPFGSMGAMGIIGRHWYDLAAALVLTSIAGTPAASSPASLTASKAILPPGYNTRLLYGPTVRKVPIRQILFPYDLGSSTYGWFSQT